MSSPFNLQQSFTFPESTNALFQFPKLHTMPSMQCAPLWRNPIISDISKNIFPNIGNLVIPPPPSAFQIDRICTQSNEDIIDDTKFTDPHPIRSQIEMEQCYWAEKKQILSELHQEYDMRLRGLKQAIIELKQKCAIIEQNPSEDSIQSLFHKTQKEYESRKQQTLARSHYEKQFSDLCVENNNLKVIVETLKKQLNTVHSEHANHLKGDGMIHPYALSNNKYFQDISTANRRLERQIKFMKHIIERESTRNITKKL